MSVNILLAQNENFKFVKVSFDDAHSKLYTYKTMEDLEVGDKVIVMSPHTGETVVEVKEVLDAFEVDLSRFNGYKWVVQKVDTTAYDKAVELEKDLSIRLRKTQAQQAREKLLEQLAESISNEELANLTKLVKL